ncbi:MAG: sigma-70 family RNA polymerase sigma factor [Armatimonadetes bacterium]|nr:sigma-70 family RNA polymerase sigma factor [Armatimonadota bacterium]MDW8122423.1 sigma-70 family RNA polymerase sigma factor [Armatimonadota bacterium]
MEERTLVEQATQGDDAAFQALIALYRPRLLSIAYHLLGDREEAEDLVQEALLRAFTRLGYYDPAKGSFLNWLTVIMVRLGVNWIGMGRKRDSVLVLESEVAESFRSGVDLWDGLEQRETGREMERRLVIQKGLALLPRQQRAVLLLRYTEDLTVKEISEALDVPVGTVKSWLFRGRQTLRAYLKEAGLL